MAKDQYSLLGLGRARSGWFADVALWTTSGTIPAEFSKCLSASEANQRIGSMRQFSALLVESGIAGLDRDLIDLAHRNNIPTFVIEPNSENADHWFALNAAAVLPTNFTPADLLYALSSHSRPVSIISADSFNEEIEEVVAWKGDFIAVCGPGGTGASTIAIALAQGLAAEYETTATTALVDLARNGEQAMLHHSGDVVPGIEELVELNRNRRATIEEIHSLTFSVRERGYALMLGMRRSGAWASMPPRAVENAINGLRRSYRTTVADISGDFEGEAEGGSLEVEERNATSRISALMANVVIVVMSPGMKGVHAGTKLVRELLTLGVDPSKIIAVVNRASKSGRGKAETSNAIRQLVDHDEKRHSITAPIFLPDRPIEADLRDGTKLPKQLCQPITKAIVAVLNHQNEIEYMKEKDLMKVIPNSLGLVDEAIGE